MKTAFVLAALAVATAAEAETQLVFRAAQGSMIVTPADIAEAKAGADMAGQPQVDLRLDRKAKARLAAFTRANIGNELVITLCEVELVRPMLLTAIEGGRLLLPDLDGRQVAGIAEVLRGTRGCEKGFEMPAK